MSWRATIFLAALCASSACFGPKQYAELPQAEPELVRLTNKDRGTGTLVRSWTVLVHENGQSVKHGPDRHWYPSGARLSEGRWDHGEPTGELRTWYESGQLKSEFTFDPGGGLAPMKFWHENGQLSASGYARSGKREGLWEFWFEDGALRERGGFIGGRRAGQWTFCHEDGSVESTGSYDAGERVGSWRHFERGERMPRPARRAEG